MKLRTTAVMGAILLSAAQAAQTDKVSQFYAGQTEPGDVPVVFMPGVVSVAGSAEHTLAFSPKGDELFFARGHWPDVKIMHMVKTGDTWSAPVPAAFLKDDRATQPVFSPDGRYLYFPTSRGKKNIESFSLWRSKKTKGGWAKPEPIVDMGVAPLMEFHPSVSRDGTVYFLFWNQEQIKGDIYASDLRHGKYPKPYMLKSPISTEYEEIRPTVDPDGKYLIFESKRPGGLGETDMYVTCKEADGTWSAPRNFKEVNSAGYDATPNISPDGKYWFVERDGDVYWRKAPIIPCGAGK